MSIKAVEGIPDYELYFKRLKDDFFFFLSELWINRGLDQKAPLGDIERDMADWIMQPHERIGVLAFRFFGKTMIFAVAYTLWQLNRDVNHRVMIVQKAGGEAEKTVGLARDWINAVPFLQHLKPQRADTDRDARYQFDVGGSLPDRNPSFSAKGLEGAIAGTRANTVIIDDIEDEENTITHAARFRLLQRNDEFEAIASYPGARIIVLGTFHHEESVYKALAGQNFHFRTWPILYPSPQMELVNLSPMLQERLDKGEKKPGDLVCPYRFDMDFVKKKQARGARFFAMQYMLQANIHDVFRNPLKLSDLIVFDPAPDKAPLTIGWGVRNQHGDTCLSDGEVPHYGYADDHLRKPIIVPDEKEWHKFSRVCGWVDPSGGAADPVGWAIGGSINGYVYILECGELIPGGTSEYNLDFLASKLFLHRARTCFMEANYGGDAPATLLQNAVNKIKRDVGDTDVPEGWGCYVEPKFASSRSAKEMRIIGALEPLMASHRLVVTRAVAACRSFQFQLTRLTTDRNSLEHDDVIESVACLARELSITLLVDPHRGEQLMRERRLEESMKRFPWKGSQPKKPPSWIVHTG